MAVNVLESPSGDNYINDCGIWVLSITGQVNESIDERGLYRLVSDDGVVTELVSLPPVGTISVKFSKEISGVLETPVPNFSALLDASDIRKDFWLEYGYIVFDKENRTKTENLGSVSGKASFINGYKNPGNSTRYTSRPSYMLVPRNHIDYIYSEESTINLRIRTSTGLKVEFTMNGVGDVTAYGIGPGNNPVLGMFSSRLVTYDVVVGSKTYKFKIDNCDIRAFNDDKFTTSKDRVSAVMFLEPSGGYSCMPVRHLTSVHNQMNYQEICIYDEYKSQNVSIFGKESTSDYSFQTRSPRTQQFGLWTQHFAASTKYFVLLRDESGDPSWVPFIVDSVEEGYSHDELLFSFTGYIKINS